MTYPPVPTFEDIQRMVQDALKNMMPGQVPTFASSRVTAPVKGWCRAEYYDSLTGQKFSFYEPPTVIAIALSREGLSRIVTAPTISIPAIKLPTAPSITIPTIKLPTIPPITIPKVELPTVPGISFPGITLPAMPEIPEVSIPQVTDIITKEIERIQRVDFNSDEYCKLIAQSARDKVNTLAPPWPLNLVWDFVCGNLVYWGFYAGWYAGGWVLNVLWDSFVQPQIDRVRNSINSVVGEANAKINSQLTKIRDGFTDAFTKIKDTVNQGLADLKSKTEGAFNVFRGNVETSVSGAMSDYSSKVQVAFNSYRVSIETSISGAMADYSSKVQDGFNGLRSNIEAGLSTALINYNKNVQVALNDYRLNIESSVNAGLMQFIPALYDMIGLPAPQASSEEAAMLREMGDVNGDGVIDMKDLDLIKAAYESGRYDPACDLNHDGVIDITDITTASQNYGKRAVSTVLLLSPIEIRNVAKDSFEFYSLQDSGFELSYIAIGRR